MWKTKAVVVNFLNGVMEGVAWPTPPNVKRLTKRRIQTVDAARRRLEAFARRRDWGSIILDGTILGLMVFEYSTEAVVRHGDALYHICVNGGRRGACDNTCRDEFLKIEQEEAMAILHEDWGIDLASVDI